MSVGEVGPRASRTRAAWWAVAVGIVLGVGCYWLPFLPFQDLPAHAGLMALRARLRDGGVESASYVLDDQLSPYFLFRFVGDLLSRKVGAVGAVRVLGALPVMLLPLSLVLVHKKWGKGANVSAAAIGLSLSLGFMGLLGFASFLLGMAYFAYLVGEWLFSLDESAARTRTRLALLSMGLVLVHGHAFLLLVAAVAVFVLVAPRREALRTVALSLGPALALAAYLVVHQNQNVAPEAAAKVPYAPLALHFQGPLDKLSLLATPTLFSRLGLDALVSVFLFAFVVATVGPAFGNFRRQTLATQRASGGVAVFAVAFLALPHSVGWFGFVDGRLLLPIVVLASYANIGELRSESWPLGLKVRDRIARALPFLALLQVVVVAVATYRFQSEAKPFEAIAARIPTGARLLYLPFRAESEHVTGHPFQHYDKLILAERALIVSQFWWHQGTGVYPKPGHPALRLSKDYLRLEKGDVPWASYALDEWTHVLLRGTESGPPGYALVAESGAFRLYSRDSQVASAPK